MADRVEPAEPRAVPVPFGPVLIACLMAGLSVFVAPGAAGWLGAGLAAVAVAIAVVDARHFLIPNELNALGVVLGLVHAAVRADGETVAAVGDAAVRAGATAVAFYGLWAVYRRLRGREGLGLGDVKLAAVAGAWLGWPIIPVAVEIAALSALVWYGWHLRRRGRVMRARARLPFGLFFGPAIWIGWLIDVILPS